MPARGVAERYPCERQREGQGLCAPASAMTNKNRTSIVFVVLFCCIASFTCGWATRAHSTAGEPPHTFTAPHGVELLPIAVVERGDTVYVIALASNYTDTPVELSVLDLIGQVASAEYYFSPNERVPTEKGQLFVNLDFEQIGTLSVPEGEKKIVVLPLYVRPSVFHEYGDFDMKELLVEPRRVPDRSSKPTNEHSGDILQSSEAIYLRYRDLTPPDRSSAR